MRSYEGKSYKDFKNFNDKVEVMFINGDSYQSLATNLKTSVEDVKSKINLAAKKGQKDFENNRCGIIARIYIKTKILDIFKEIYDPEFTAVVRNITDEDICYRILPMTKYQTTVKNLSKSLNCSKNVAKTIVWATEQKKKMHRLLSMFAEE